MNDDPETEAMLARAMSRFKFRVAMHQMGIPLKPPPVYCKCAFIDDDGTYVPGEPAGCELHPNRGALRRNEQSS